jgi:hypothetical protein
MKTATHIALWCLALLVVTTPPVWAGGLMSDSATRLDTAYSQSAHTMGADVALVNDSGYHILLVHGRGGGGRGGGGHGGGGHFHGGGGHYRGGWGHSHYYGSGWGFWGGVGLAPFVFAPYPRVVAPPVVVVPQQYRSYYLEGMPYSHGQVHCTQILDYAQRGMAPSDWPVDVFNGEAMRCRDQFFPMMPIEPIQAQSMAPIPQSALPAAVAPAPQVYSTDQLECGSQAQQSIATVGGASADNAEYYAAYASCMQGRGYTP